MLFLYLLNIISSSISMGLAIASKNTSGALGWCCAILWLFVLIVKEREK